MELAMDSVYGLSQNLQTTEVIRIYYLSRELHSILDEEPRSVDE